MARPVRVEYPHAAHHVAARGNERKPIYRSDRDRRMFLDTLATACERFGLVVHAYRGYRGLGLPGSIVDI